MSSFVHLHVHSQYSILDASASLYGLVNKAVALGMPALALTDHGNLFGAVDFYKLCKEHKIKPIIGCEMYVAPTSRFEKKKIGSKAAHHLTLIAKNEIGYKNLCKLSSLGYTEGFYYYPRIDLELLAQYKEGLICLSGCLESAIALTALNSPDDALENLVKEYKTLFGDDFYLEVQRHSSLNEELQLDGMFDESWLYSHYQEHTQKQEKLISKFAALSKKCNIPCVATNNVHYIERDDWKAHEILLNIQSGEPVEEWQRDSMGNPKFKTPNPKRSTFASHELYFKSQEDMQALFSDMPGAISKTLEIVEKCTLEIDLKTKHYPVFVPEGNVYSKKTHNATVEKFLWDLCEKGINKRYTEHNLKRVAEKYPGKDPLEVVRERLKYEMNVICPKGMCDYLLIVWDFINWAKNNGIPMGPGRGSGAGSIILYLTEITDIEPLQFNLFFERFINPERVSYPDIDVDICMQRRGEVINYTIQRFGKDNVAQIITFGSMKAKMVLKDVGRVLNIPLSKVNAIAKLIPEDLNITLEKALEKDADLKAAYESDDETRSIIDIGKKLEGSVRNTGIHAAGMIISGDPLLEHIPVCVAKDSSLLVTQYSMKPVEMVGMLKIDFLGLKTLTSVKLCIEAIAAKTGKTIDWINLPLDDVPTFSLLNHGKTLGVFQLESGGMQELAKQLHLDKFEEIIAVVALYRPGPMDMIPSYIARKHGKEAIESEHPWMEEILAETYGVMVYQEQVMQIAQKLANYSLGEGDVLRRAMGKKDKNEMQKQREKFLTGAKANNIEEEVAARIFDKMEKFAEYGFNKSHAAAYGYLTYVTAYLKANYPSQWLAALMTCDQNDTEKVAKFFHESREMQIPVLAPDINESETTFVATESGIRFALSGIKGVGEGVVDAIVEERKKGGKFKSLYDTIRRVDTKRVGKKVTELLIEAGCFDSFGHHRDDLRLSLDAFYDQVQREQKEAVQGVISLFAKIEPGREPKIALSPSRRPKEDLFIREKELLGFFLSGHPLDSLSDTLKRLSCVGLCQAEDLPMDSIMRCAFIIEEVSVRISSKTLKKFAIMRISDGDSGKYELPIWPEMYEELQGILVENRLVWGILTKEKRENSWQLSCKWLAELKQLNEAAITECDAAFDKAKKQQAMRASYNKKPTSDKPPKKETVNKAPAKTKKVLITLDLERLRATHILHLQKCIARYPGPTPLELSFCIQEQEHAVVSLDSSKGIAIDDSLENDLSLLSSFLKLEVQ